MDTEEGHIFIKKLAEFVRAHERALANAIQHQRQGSGSTLGAGSQSVPGASAPVHFSLAAVLPLLGLGSKSKPVRLTLTPHHLFYLLTRFSELGISIGPMDIRIENIHAATSPGNYVSFLSQAQRKKISSDRDSIRSVSSVRSIMSGMSSLWTNIGFSSKSAAKLEKQKAVMKDDLKYLYSAFTKVPGLRLSPDHQAPLIAGYEEFPFDSAVPLFAFKNLSSLELCDVDFRQFYGWDRLADQLRSLTVKRAGVDDPIELLCNVVLDDMDKRRRRSTRGATSPITPWASSSPTLKQAELSMGRSASTLESKYFANKTASPEGSTGKRSSYIDRPRSTSPTRPSSSRHGYSHSQSYTRSNTPYLRRTSESSNSTDLTNNTPRASSSNLLLSYGTLPSTKWRFLRHLSITEAGFTNISVSSLAPVANTLQSLDLSCNLFTEVPDSLASLVSLRSLNLSHCMIESLHSLLRNPLPAITTLNLKANRLKSLAGIERLLSLERIDLRENKLTDPAEIARLTGIPHLSEVYVNRNPFVRTHSNYRITIFNLFRSTPGYTEDILIDYSPPSHSERKQLVDRTLETVPKPVIPPEVIDIPILRPEIKSSLPTQRDSVIEVTQPEIPRRSTSQRGSGSRRHKKKGTRRRVVEITQEHPDQSSEAKDAVVDPPQKMLSDEVGPPKLDSYELSGSTKPDVIHGTPLPHSLHQSPQPTLPSSDILSPRSVPVDLPDSTEGLDSDSIAYRQRIEALRNEIGNAWLSALTDERWEKEQRKEQHDAGFSPALALTPPEVPIRTSTQGIVSGGRTFG